MPSASRRSIADGSGPARANFGRMRRDFSAGGVLVRRLRGEWMVAAIRPAGRPAGTWVLPKGMLEPGESSEQAALREVAEETGAHGRALARLGSLEYWFRDGDERVLKTVAFFLLRYERGALGRLPETSRHEVAQVRWLQLAEAPALLAYRGEREMAQQAAELLAGDDDV
jgi:8-oxo-dGTP pyrophosphatase MutT (NUDIX family)